MKWIARGHIAGHEVAITRVGLGLYVNIDGDAETLSGKTWRKVELMLNSSPEEELKHARKSEPMADYPAA